MNAKKVVSIVRSCPHGNDLFFPQALEYFYTQAGEVLKENRAWKKTKLSSGISSVDMFDFYKELVTRDITNGIYKKYTTPAGDLDVRYCLGAYSNLCIGETLYTREDYCLTDGATGGISSFLEWYSQTYKDGNVVIPSPNYYLAKLECRRLGLMYTEVCTITFGKPADDHFSTLNAIEKTVTEKTRLIIITNPSNPGGKLLRDEEIDALIKFAQKRNIILLVDSIFLGLHQNHQEYFATPDPFLCLGKKNNYLYNIFFCTGLSKDRNIPGFRFGYIYSKNQEGIKKIVELQEGKSFFSAGSNIRTLAIYDTFFRYINVYMQHHGMKKPEESQAAIKEIIHNDDVFSQTIRYEEAIIQYIKFMQYFNDVSNTYTKNRARTIELLGAHLKNVEENEHFNFFVNIDFKKNINLFDFCVNLFIVTGIKIQPGPYFGFSQRFWEQQEGLWLRITYGYDLDDLEIGIPKLLSFIAEYKNIQSGHLIHTNLTFKEYQPPGISRQGSIDIDHN